MDLVLLTITMASLLTAAIASWIAWRLAREERRRSAARVAALEAAIETDPPALASPAATQGLTASATAAEPRAIGLFSATQQEGATAGRFVPAVLAGVLIVGGLVATALMFSGSETRASAPTPDAPTGSRPLELLSLRHELNDGTVRVTGLVRNPPVNGELQRVTAVVFLFDERGGFLASSRAPLDFTSLAPGEESPFTVSVTAPSGVARYRVSFRRDEGGVIPHVDRRDTRNSP
jgi:hypothetical protein